MTRIRLGKYTYFTFRKHWFEKYEEMKKQYDGYLRFVQAREERYESIAAENKMLRKKMQQMKKEVVHVQMTPISLPLTLRHPGRKR